MKKGIKNLAIATMVGVASMGLMTGCQKEEDKPYIQVSGLDTAYIQNEGIDLEGAKILYYSNKNDTTADEIKLTESMIANFDTDTTGEKKMKVLWNNLELEINYSVFSASDFINIYNNAFENLMNAENVHADMIIGQGSEQINASSNLKNNKCYIKVDGFGDSKIEEWYEQYGGKWYKYCLEVEKKSRKDISSEILNNNVMGYVVSSFIASGSKLSVEDLNGFNGYSIDVENGKIIWTVNFPAEENQTGVLKYTIENEKIIECEWKVLNQNNEIVTINLSTISYNIEDVEMVDLPTNIVWEDVVEG